VDYVIELIDCTAPDLYDRYLGALELSDQNDVVAAIEEAGRRRNEQ
jgi:hypothetical protein